MGKATNDATPEAPETHEHTSASPTKYTLHASTAEHTIVFPETQSSSITPSSSCPVAGPSSSFILPVEVVVVTKEQHDEKMLQPVLPLEPHLPVENFKEDEQAAHILESLMNGVSGTIENTALLTDIQNIFSPSTKNENVTASKPKSKRTITSHRLLTSDEIISAKRADKEKKLQLEQEKEQRKIKREQKRASLEQEKIKKEKNGQSTSTSSKRKRTQSEDISPVVNKNMCFICCQLWSKDDPHDWVGCHSCGRWMHQRCVPAYHSGVLENALKSNKPFICHICTHFN